MQTKTADADKRTDADCDIALISEDQIRRLDDGQPDADGCRFAAVARSLETTRAPNTQIELPVTVVAYVDASGEYAIETEHFGHRPDWAAIPRTIAVDADAPVSQLPPAHQETYAPILDTYERVLDEE